MTTRTLLLLALLLPPAAAEEKVVPLPDDPSIAAHVLNSARKDLKVARTDFKHMSPDERGVVKDARGAVEKTAFGRALAPSLGAAADLLEAASAGKGRDAELCAHMARTYRAMAEELDKDASYLPDDLRGREPGARADATFAEAEKLLAAAGDAGRGETSEMGILKRTDPLWRALAGNLATLSRGYATLDAGKHDEKLAGAVAKAEKLQKALEPWFAGVRTTRDEPPPAPGPAPAG
jgi:hypothetical protein